MVGGHSTYRDDISRRCVHGHASRWFLTCAGFVAIIIPVRTFCSAIVCIDMGACVLAYWAEGSLELVWPNGILLVKVTSISWNLGVGTIPNQYHEGLIVVYFPTDWVLSYKKHSYTMYKYKFAKFKLSGTGAPT